MAEPLDVSTSLPGQQLLHNLACIPETLGELRIVANQIVVKVPCLAIALLVYVSDVTLVGCQQDLTLIVKHDLDGLIAQTEQNSMFGSDPLLDENKLSII